MSLIWNKTMCHLEQQNAPEEEIIHEINVPFIVEERCARAPTLKEPLVFTFTKPNPATNARLNASIVNPTDNNIIE